MGRVLTYSQLAAETTRTLATVYPQSEAKAMTRLIFERLKGFTPADLVLKGAQDVGDYIIGKTQQVVNRLLKNEPIQYIFGIADFYGMDFKVTPDVLIPRSETAELVDIIVKDWGGRADLEVADLCTGSGCIAVALARNLPFSCVTAVDVSATALSVAKENAKNLKARINFVEADVLSLSSQPDSFDIIVSNPPYITEKEKKGMDANVLDYEPHLALFVPDDDPLKFYKPIAEFAAGSLKSRGMLYFEINPDYADEISNCLRGSGFEDIEIIKDTSAKNRFIKAVHE